MRILFAFENPLPNTQADAEVFIATARTLAPLAGECWLHAPVLDKANRATVAKLAGMAVIPAWVPRGPAALRHLFCGLTLALHAKFHQADLIYTRNLWIAWMAVLFGQKVVFDHYRPWPEQIPPLQPWIYRLFCHPRFLAGICHSAYTRRKYLELGIPADKLVCIHNGFEPRRFADRLSVDEAKRRIGVAPGRKTVVYTGRINRKKGLSLVVAAAKRLPELLFILVGADGDGAIEAQARDVANIRIVPFQAADALVRYISAADLLLIPPSLQPLTRFGSTVLPLKLFLYLAAARPILAGDTPDVREILHHGENAFLCPPDSVDALVAGIATLMDQPRLARHLAMAARIDSHGFTWEARARRIAALIAARIEAAPAGPGLWNRAQWVAWRRQSRRWLIHLVRNGSVILPQLPQAGLPAPPVTQP